MKIHVCLMFHSARSDNLGVAALTVSQVTLLRDLARGMNVDLQITLLDWRDPRSPCVDGNDITHVPMSGRDLIDPRRALARLKAADVILDIGAGDSFSDIYGSRRFRRMIWLKNLARISGTPVVLAPQTYGPFNSRSAAFWATRTIRSARIVASRDEGSVETLRGIGVTGPVCLASDVALKLPAAKVSNLQGVNVGVNVSGLLWNGGYTGENQFGLSVDYRDMLVDVIRKLKAHSSAPTIWLVPHVISESQPVEDDLRICQSLAWEIDGARVAPAFETPQAAKGFISQLDFLTGSRMHACIAAFSSNVAVVPLAYSGKFARLFGSLGYSRTADCRTLQQAEVVRRVTDGFVERQAVRRELDPALATGLERLSGYEAALAELFEGLALGRDMLNPRLRVQHG